MVDSAPEGAGESEVTEIRRDAGIDAQAVKGRIEAKDVLRDIRKGPCGRAGQPAVFAFAEIGGVGAGNHLRVDIGLGAMDLAEFLYTGRAGLPIHFKCPASVSEDRLCDRDPGIVVAEDAGIFLVSRRIGGDFAQLYVIAGVGRMQELHAIFGIKDLTDTFESLSGLTALCPDAGKDTEALWLDVDLALFTFAGTDLMTVGVIGTYKPFSVPAVRQNSFFHKITLSADLRRFSGIVFL